MWKPYSRNPPSPSTSHNLKWYSHLKEGDISRDPRRRSQCTGAKAILQFFFCQVIHGRCWAERTRPLTGFWMPRKTLEGRCGPTFPSWREDTPLEFWCLMYTWPAPYSLSLSWAWTTWVVQWFGGGTLSTQTIRVEQHRNQIEWPNYQYVSGYGNNDIPCFVFCLFYI